MHTSFNYSKTIDKHTILSLLTILNKCKQIVLIRESKRGELIEHLKVNTLSNLKRCILIEYILYILSISTLFQNYYKSKLELRRFIIELINLNNLLLCNKILNLLFNLIHIDHIRKTIDYKSRTILILLITISLGCDDSSDSIIAIPSLRNVFPISIIKDFTRHTTIRNQSNFCIRILYKSQHSINYFICIMAWNIYSLTQSNTKATINK